MNWYPNLYIIYYIFQIIKLVIKISIKLVISTQPIVIRSCKNSPLFLYPKHIPNCSSFYKNSHESRRFYYAHYREAINFKEFVTIRRAHLEYKRGKISSLARRDLISIVASAAYVFHKSQFLVAWRVYYESRRKLRNGLPCLALIIRPTRAWNRDKGIISICRGTSKTETSDNECRKVGIWFRAPLTKQPLAHMEGWGLMVAERPWTHPSPGPTIPPLTILPFSLFPALPASSSTPSATLPPCSLSKIEADSLGIQFDEL